MLFATAKPDMAGRWLDWLMTPEQIQYYGAWGMAFFAAYWIIWLVLKPNDEGGAGHTQLPSTSGSNSPAVAVAGDYHHYAAPAVKQEVITPKSYDIKAVTKATQTMAGLREPIYKRDMSLGEVADYVSTQQGFRYRSQVELEIADMINEHQMHVWGRRKRNPIEMISTISFRTLQVNLEAEYVTTLGLHAVHRTVWNDVKFSREEVERVWPKES